MSDDLYDRVLRMSDQLDTMAKHFDGHDVRHPSATHNAGQSQMVHGNRPGHRTYTGLLSALDLTPPNWHKLSPREQTDQALRLTGYASTPVIDVEGEHYLAPPGVKMLPERGAGQNVSATDTAYARKLEPNMNMAQGLDEQDKLKRPAGADEEDWKRYREAAAEHRMNDYQGPTTPHFEERWGDQLRADHPKREPKRDSGNHRDPSTTPKLHRLGRHRDEAMLVTGALANPPGANHAREAASAAANAGGGSGEGQRGRQGGTPPPVPPQYGQTSEASQRADANAERNARLQHERAQESRQASAQRRKDRLQRLGEPPKRLPPRL